MHVFDDLSQLAHLREIPEIPDYREHAFVNRVVGDHTFERSHRNARVSQKPFVNRMVGDRTSVCVEIIIDSQKIDGENRIA